MRVNKHEITRKSYNLMKMSYKVKFSVHANRPDQTICRDYSPNQIIRSTVVEYI